MKVILNIYGESYEVVINVKNSKKQKSSKSDALKVGSWLEARLWESSHDYPEHGLLYDEVVTNAHNFHVAEF